MQGRAFLLVARDDVLGLTEAHWRTAAGRAYYALFLEARDALQRWGIPPTPHQSEHWFVRLRFYIRANADLKPIGLALDGLSRLRNEADYRLAVPGRFVNNVEAQRGIVDATKAIGILDQIEADPQRRNAAIKDIRAAFP
jgi:hypothetical protein